MRKNRSAYCRPHRAPMHPIAHSTTSSPNLRHGYSSPSSPQGSLLGCGLSHANDDIKRRSRHICGQSPMPIGPCLPSPSGSSPPALSSSNRPPNSRVAPLQPRSKTSNPARDKRRLQSHNTPATKRPPPSSTPPPMPAFRSCPTKPNRFALAR